MEVGNGTWMFRSEFQILFVSLDQREFEKAEYCAFGITLVTYAVHGPFKLSGMR